jgi:hypothetical protein
MLSMTKYALSLLLFLLLYTVIQHILLRLIRSSRRRTTGGNRKKSTTLRRKLSSQKLISIMLNHLGDLLRSSQVLMEQGSFILISCMAGTAGVAVGMLYFASVKGVVIIGLFLLLAPYVWLRSHLLNKQLKHRLDLLPAVECFYQLYVLSETKNVRTVLHAALEGNRIPATLQSTFKQLYAGLMIHQDRESCLRTFSYALGSRWSDHFTAMLRYAIEDGTDLSDGLRELIADMRQAIRTDHADRNRLLEIRIANFSPLLFLAVFIAVNVRIDPKQTYYYYVVSEAGRNMMLDALMLIGASFGMGLYLSMRRI